LQAAAEAYDAVLEQAGATRPKRDAVDRRGLDQVPNATGTDDARQGVIADVKQGGGYAEYKGGPGKENGGDGMPDEWELKYGLNPNDPSDAAKDCNGDGYTNIEKYMNGLDPRTKIDWKELRNNRDLLMTGR